jgi:hypothetical protein
VVLLGVAVLVVAILALKEPEGHVAASAGTSTGTKSAPAAPTGARSTAPRPSPSTRRSTPAAPGGGSGPAVPVKSVPLVVLNNTTISGLAGRAAQRFEAGGWTVTRYGNYQNDIASTCAYYDPDEAGAKAAAEALRRQYPTIKRTKPRFAELPDGPVVVVLTPDYSEG